MVADRIETINVAPLGMTVVEASRAKLLIEHAIADFLRGADFVLVARQPHFERAYPSEHRAGRERFAFQPHECAGFTNDGCGRGVHVMIFLALSSKHIGGICYTNMTYSRGFVCKAHSGGNVSRLRATPCRTGW